jgi:hypothetical protein
VLRINILKSYLGLRERASHDDYASVWETMIKSTNHFLPLLRGLFHFADALGLLNIALGDGDWSQLFDLFPWLLAVLQELDE